MIKIELLDSNQPTQNGRIYTSEICNLIMGQILLGSITVQQERFVEKEKRNIKPYESVPRWAMADVIDATLEDGKLFINIKPRTSKNGTMLTTLIDTYGIDKINFYPVGVGTLDSEKKIQKDYKLYFISFEVQDTKKGL